jgi:hypothetical protein
VGHHGGVFEAMGEIEILKDGRVDGVRRDKNTNRRL